MGGITRHYTGLGGQTDDRLPGRAAILTLTGGKALGENLPHSIAAVPTTMTGILRFSVLLLPVFLSSCAVMTADECRQANWYDIGMRDGSAGETLAKFTDRREACAEARVVADANAYSRGRDMGLRAFCRLDNAVQVGLRGGSYQGVCPAAIDYEFRRRYDIGYAVYRARNEVESVEGRISSREHSLREADRDEEKALKAATKDDDRRRIRKDFDDKRHRLRDELHDLDRDLRRARERVRDAEAVLYSLR